VDLGRERLVRSAALDYLGTAADADGVVTWQQLKAFQLLGELVLLVGSGNGIFKPRQLDLPISILTAPGAPPGYRSRVLLSQAADLSR
jgi:hypothetical protein